MASYERHTNSFHGSLEEERQLSHLLTTMRTVSCEKWGVRWTSMKGIVRNQLKPSSAGGRLARGPFGQ